MIANAGGDGTKDSVCVNSKAKVADCSPGPAFRGLTPVRMGRLADVPIQLSLQRRRAWVPGAAIPATQRPPIELSTKSHEFSQCSEKTPNSPC